MIRVRIHCIVWEEKVQDRSTGLLHHFIVEGLKHFYEAERYGHHLAD